MTHEPSWLIDWYWSDASGQNVCHLVSDYLKGRCKLRIAGDLHHYMRHSYIPSDVPANVQHLIVNGCGGAFLHPTHVFRNFNEYCGSSYEIKAAYPSFKDSSRVMYWFLQITTYPTSGNLSSFIFHLEHGLFSLFADSFG